MLPRLAQRCKRGCAAQERQTHQAGADRYRQERDKVAEDVTARHLDKIRLLPPQASHVFSTVLAAADALLINQAPMVVDSVLPSSLFSHMASGRPVMAAAHSKSTTATSCANGDVV